MDTSKGRNTNKQELSANHVSKRDKETLDETIYNPVKGEMALWSAVITQALMDAGSESKKREAQKEKAKAIRWLLGNSADFQIVCLNAGLNPVYVRQKALEAIARNCVWRRNNTEPLPKNHFPSQFPPLSTKQYYIPKRPAYQPKPRSSIRYLAFSSVPHPANLIQLPAQRLY